MTVKELIAALQALGPDLPVLLSVDADGNAYTRLSRAFVGVFTEEDDDLYWYDPTDPDSIDAASAADMDPAVCLFPAECEESTG